MKAGKTKSDFYDYDAYVAKFKRTDLPRTTDETYTPEDVYDCVVDYVGSIFPLEGKVVERPFFPGGDYRHYPYQPNGVVIDNPPFSILRKIVAYYLEIGHPFFLFAPAEVSAHYLLDGCTVFLSDTLITFDNGARIHIAFVGNLTPQWGVVCASTLRRAIYAASSQQRGGKLNAYALPPNMFHFSDFSCLTKLYEETFIPASEVCSIRPKREGGRAPFGKKFLLSDTAAQLLREKRDEAKRVNERQKIPVTLTPEQEELLRQLNSHANP